ncbi:hypothetical protein GCM10007989_09440 [Devosia pacifica]|uniref:Uncharacterized protein n=1 Tax=Devosia pacifica TaxID=1335967 RepID=A0A918RYY5_9HYPH|nr:hypothetical protein [Devosia pacifica]GHA16517.1 hypothetical protein GCM10007989_09440 [Devosia pacifica]
MATPDRDRLYTEDGNRTVYTRESNGTGWFVGIIVALALLAIGYLVFSANSGPSTTTNLDVQTAPAVEAPAAEPAAPVGDVTPLTETPAESATPVAPAEPSAPVGTETTAADGDEAVAPVEEPVQ